VWVPAGPEAADDEPRNSAGQAAKRKRGTNGTSRSPRGRGGRTRARGPRAAGLEDADAALQAAVALGDAAELWDEGDEAAGDGSESGELADGHDMPALPGLPSRVQSVATELPSREEQSGELPPRVDPPANPAPQKKPRRHVSFAAPADSDDEQDDDEGLSPMAEPDSATADAPQAALVHPKRRGRKVVSDKAHAAADATGGDDASRSRASAEGPPKRKRKQTSGLSNGGLAGSPTSAHADGPPKQRRKQSRAGNISGVATGNGTLANGTSQQPVEASDKKRGRSPKSKPAEVEAQASGITNGQAPSDAPKRKAGRPAKTKPVELMPDIPTRGKPAESPKRKRGRPPKAKPSAEPDGQQEVVKRKRGRPPKANPAAAGSEQASNGSVSASGEPQPGAAQGPSKQMADLDTAALLRASQLQMAAIEAALAEDD